MMTIVECKYCGKKITSNRKKGRLPKYCSHKCVGLSQRKIEQKECPVCGTIFTTYGARDRREYCSKSCGAKMRVKEHIVKICPQCNKTFEVLPSGKDRIFCSQECCGQSVRGDKSPVWNGGGKASRERTEKKLKYNIQYRIHRRMKDSIRFYLKRRKSNKKNMKTEDLIGYTIEHLKNHLENTMPEGYSWQDFLENKLHIDHIRPVSSFTFASYKDKDFQRCWALENLQLLEATENLRKGARCIY